MRIRLPLSKLVLPLGITALLAAAVAPGCVTVASHAEYRRYRAVESAEDERGRLLALRDYLENHPGGFWAEGYATERQEAEAPLWGQVNTDPEGLRFYLEAYPEGRYASLAQTRISAYDEVGQRARRAEEAELEARDAQRRAAAEARLGWVSQAVGFWARTMINLRGYGSSIRRIAERNEEFADYFGNRPPAPTCEPDHCLKHYGQSYTVPVPGGTAERRRMDVYLRLVLERGRINRIEILMPNMGFSRWYEMIEQQLVTDEDPEQRQLAINWALDFILPIVRAEADGAEPIDFIPEVISPLAESEVGAESDAAPEGLEETPAEGEEGAETAGGEAPSEPGVATGTDEGASQVLDDLLSGASGIENPIPEQEPEEPSEPVVEEPEELVLPVNLLAARFRNLRVVVFAAGEGDYGSGFDGLLVELDRE